MNVVGDILIFLFLFPLMFGFVLLIAVPLGALGAAAVVTPLTIRHLLKLKPQRKRILIVEDDAAAKLVLEQIVKSALPHAMITISDSEEDATRMLHEGARIRNSFDFVIADIFLAGSGTGLDLWRKHRNSKMPFVIASVTERSIYDQMLNNDGESPLAEADKPKFLQKPFDLLTSQSVIRSAVGSV